VNVYIVSNQEMEPVSPECQLRVHLQVDFGMVLTIALRHGKRIRPILPVKTGRLAEFMDGADGILGSALAEHNRAVAPAVSRPAFVYSECIARYLPW
jgi:hypothetical protein